MSGQPQFSPHIGSAAEAVGSTLRGYDSQPSVDHAPGHLCRGYVPIHATGAAAGDSSRSESRDLSIRMDKKEDTCMRCISERPSAPGCGVGDDFFCGLFGSKRSNGNAAYLVVVHNGRRYHKRCRLFDSSHYGQNF